MYLKIITFVLLALSAQRLSAQQVGDSLRITLLDETIIQGQLFEKRPDYWVIETKSLGQMEVKKEHMLGFVLLKFSKPSIQAPKRRLTSPNYWSAPSAIPLEVGEGHYQMSDLVVHTVQYGFTKHLSVSAGFELISVIDPFSSNNSQKTLNFPAFSVASVRYTHSLHPNFHVAGGFLIGRDQFGIFSGVQENKLKFRVLHGTATWGTRDYNLSLTYGHRLEKILFFPSFPTIDRQEQTMNFISWGGKINIGTRFSWVGEYWSWTDAFSTDRTGMINLGFRYAFRRCNIGMGVLMPFSEGASSEAFPLLTLGVPFQLL